MSRRGRRRSRGQRQRQDEPTPRPTWSRGPYEPGSGSAPRKPWGRYRHRGLLWVVAALGLLALVCVLVIVPETHPAKTGQAPASDAASDATSDAAADAAAGSTSGLRALLSRDYLTNTLAFSFGFATMMAYISALPFLYQKYMGLSTVQYGIAFAVNALALMVVSILSAKLTARFRFVRWPAPAWASTCSAPPSTASSAWWTPRR